jgi:hypothetical protein
MRGLSVAIAILVSASVLHARPFTRPLPVVHLELLIDDKSFVEMGRIYTNDYLKQIRATNLANAAIRLALIFKPMHPFVDWSGHPDPRTPNVFRATITERDHAVSALWTIYPHSGTGQVGAPCVIYSRFQTKRHLQEPALLANDVFAAMTECIGAAGLDPTKLSPFHTALRSALKNIAIAKSIDAVDDEHIYLPLEWQWLHPGSGSLFRVDYWSIYKGTETHGVVFLGNPDRESPRAKSRISTIPHVCDDHPAKFSRLVRGFCGCEHKHALNAATRYNGLLQTMQHRDPATTTNVYVEVYEFAEGSAIVDDPDSVPQRNGAHK